MKINQRANRPSRSTRTTKQKGDPTCVLSEGIKQRGAPSKIQSMC